MHIDRYNNEMPFEAMNKGSDKRCINLNSGDANEWTVWYGPQDKYAPMHPWELEASDLESMMASVPGNIEIDLEREGIIEDPLIGENVFNLRKFETYHWWYKREFQKPEISREERIELCFEGIDSIADIWLNDQLIARVDNMLVEHRYDVTGIIETQNVLLVHIKSTELEARKFVRNHLGIRKDQLSSAVHIRKAAHMFGWDIMPRLMSAGIWKGVSLEMIKPNFFSSVYWVTRSVNVVDNTADLYVDWQFHTDHLNIDDLKINIELERNGDILYQHSFPVITTVSRHTINGLSNVEPWWPKGMGEPSLYNARVRLTDSDGNTLSVNEQVIGIRTAELVYTAVGTSEVPGDFHFRINGEKVFIKGTNWVPLDGLHSRDLNHLQDAIDMAVDLNCNMIRCWGGNVYESDNFYTLCDEHGIMVWQDFAMGCTIYPQDENFTKKVKTEAEKVIRRLRHHPSIVLWAGNNENDVSLGWEDAQSHIDPNTDILSREILPRAVREWDPERPYLPSSPFISSEAFSIENRIVEEYSPERHLWGPRGYYKAGYYTDHHASFVSEIGYHGCPDISSLEKMMTPESVYPWTNRNEIEKQLSKTNGKPGDIDNLFSWNAQWHCKATSSHKNSPTQAKRNNLMINQVIEVFGRVPADLEDFVFASQAVQAEAMKYFIEFWRMDKRNRNGILWWNLRDGWPILSDAVVDYYHNKKLAYHYIKRSQTDVCVMIGDATPKGHPVAVVNDTRQEWNVQWEIRNGDTNEMISANEVSITPNGMMVVDHLPTVENDELWLIEYSCGKKHYKNHYISYTPPLSLEKYQTWISLIQ